MTLHHSFSRSAEISSVIIVAMKTFRYFLLVFLALTVVPVHAADFTIFGGMQHPGKLTVRSIVDNSTTIPLDPRDFGTFGIRVSQGRVFGSETTLAYSPNFISSDNSAFIFNGNLLVQAPLVAVRPYATAGLGTVYVRGDTISALDAITGAKFAVNYGGGLKFKLAGPLGGQFDARGYSLTGVQSERLNIFEVSVGIVFSF
ncbi:MAG: outer membrane beta-barrel protein [Acidobacteria bacterium]|nr:outer membrane beta-barrel protein [Acidobacteriota bacterium]